MKVLSIRRITNDRRHNAFTGACWFKGEAISLFCGGAINEAWVWVNGEYVGHREHVIWWMGKNEIDFDVSEFVRPGKNTIAIRIWNDVEIGGMLNRGFLWSPNKVETAPVPTDEK